MIGVIANPEDHVVVQEFFELFKTPWEFYRSGREYDVLLCDGDCEVQQNKINLVLMYSSQKLQCDGETKIQNEEKDLQYNGSRLPIYGTASSFPGQSLSFLKSEKSENTAAYITRIGEVAKARIGYDLFPEIRTLLTNGQPTANAGIPTLDLHIEILRRLKIGRASCRERVSISVVAVSLKKK